MAQPTPEAFQLARRDLSQAFAKLQRMLVWNEEKEVFEATLHTEPRHTSNGYFVEVRLTHNAPKEPMLPPDPPPVQEPAAARAQPPDSASAAVAPTLAAPKRVMPVTLVRSPFEPAPAATAPAIRRPLPKL